MRYLISPILASLLLTTPGIAVAETNEVTLSFNGLTLNADFNTADTDQLDQVVLITHGTLAHKDMEIIQNWQDLLSDENIPSLAINLSLGVDNRHGMYNCGTPHKHKHTDAIDEINAWVEWLSKEQGAQSIVLAAHSRGANQTAWFNSMVKHDSIQAQILLAPATWSETGSRQDYNNQYKQPLEPLIKKALSLQPDTLMTNIDFIYCPDSTVTASSFISYYQVDPRFHTPNLLKEANIPTLVIAGSEDTTVKGLTEAMSAIENLQVKTVEIDGADHFFRDLYMDEVIEHSISFMENL